MTPVGLVGWSARQGRSPTIPTGFIRAVGNPHAGTGSAQFHLLTSTFGTTVSTRDSAPIERIRQLRADGLSLAEIARQAGSTAAVVRWVVGKVDQEARRKKQEEIARRIDGEPQSWGAKVAHWKAETGQSDVTFGRVLKRFKG